MMLLGRHSTGTKSRIRQHLSPYEHNKLPDVTKLLQKLTDKPASHDPTPSKTSTANSRINFHLWILKLECGFCNIKRGSKGRRVTRMPGDGLDPTSFMRSTQMMPMCSKNSTEQSSIDTLLCTDSNFFISEPINTYYILFHPLISTLSLLFPTRRMKSSVTFMLITFTKFFAFLFPRKLITYCQLLLIFQAWFIIWQTMISRHPTSGKGIQLYLICATRTTSSWAPKWLESKPM